MKQRGLTFGHLGILAALPKNRYLGSIDPGFWDQVHVLVVYITPLFSFIVSMKSDQGCLVFIY